MCPQARGLLNIAESQKGKPLPPFEKWSFTKRRYIQYICDQSNVHFALEGAIETVTDSGPRGPQTATHYRPSADCEAAFDAAACFGDSSGLER